MPEKPAIYRLRDTANKSSVTNGIWHKIVTSDGSAGKQTPQKSDWHFIN